MTNTYTDRWMTPEECAALRAQQEIPFAKRVLEGMFMLDSVLVDVTDEEATLWLADVREVLFGQCRDAALRVLGA